MSEATEWEVVRSLCRQGADGRWLLSDEIVHKYPLVARYVAARPAEWTRLPELSMWRHRDVNLWKVIHVIQDHGPYPVAAQ